MKKIFLFILLLGLAAVGRAEQTVVTVLYHSSYLYGFLVDDQKGWATSRKNYSIMNTPAEIADLLKKGWRITHVSTTAGDTSNPYMVVYILEKSP